MTTRSSFDNELQELNKSLEEMSLMAERAIEKSLEALQNNDSELAKEIMADHVRAMLRTAISAFINRDIQTAKEVEKMDDVIDQLFDKAKEEVVQLLREDGSKSDKAIDFLMIAKYLERIGDHAVNVCEWTEFSVTGAVNNIRIL